MLLKPQREELEDGEIEEGEIVDEQDDREEGEAPALEAGPVTERYANGRADSPPAGFSGRFTEPPWPHGTDWQHHRPERAPWRGQRAPLGDHSRRDAARQQRSRQRSPDRGRSRSKEAYAAAGPRSPRRRQGSKEPLPEPPHQQAGSQSREASVEQSQDATPEEDGGRLHRERTELNTAVRALTKAVAVPDAMKRLEQVCSDLRAALRKLRALCKLLKEAGGVTGADDCEELAMLGTLIFKGLRAVNVVANTGAGRGMDLGPARELMEAAQHGKTELFRAPLRKELDDWTRSSRLFQAEQLRAAAAAASPPNGVHSHQLGEPPASPDGRAAKRPRHAGAAAESLLSQPDGAGGPPPPPLPRDETARPSGPMLRLASGTVQSVAGATQPVSLTEAAEQPLPPYDPYSTEHAAPPPPPPPQAPGNPPMDLPPRPASASGWADKGLEPIAAEASAPGALAQLNGHLPDTAAEDYLQLDAIAADVNALLQRQKLCLVLDLDHTLVNSAKVSEVEAALSERLAVRERQEQERWQPQQRLLYSMPAIQMWTKLRPGVREFLTTCARAFELWIHTNGNRSYAMAIVQILDPEGDLFGHRIIAQGTGGGGNEVGAADMAKRLMAGLEGREAVAVIVDDSTSVWEAHAQNLLAVERYVYFPSSRRQFGLKGKSLLEVNRDENAETGMLRVAAEVLMRVHAAVFSALSAPPTRQASGELVYQDWDVRHILQLERTKVLAGVRIMFSRIIPLEQQPDTHPLWRLAERFGATCAAAMEEAVTHVITNTKGTEKVFWARRNGKFVVTTAWLECSCTLWKRAHEERFQVP